MSFMVRNEWIQRSLLCMFFMVYGRVIFISSPHIMGAATGNSCFLIIIPFAKTMLYHSLFITALFLLNELYFWCSCHNREVSFLSNSHRTCTWCCPLRYVAHDNLSQLLIYETKSTFCVDATIEKHPFCQIHTTCTLSCTLRYVDHDKLPYLGQL